MIETRVIIRPISNGVVCKDYTGTEVFMKDPWDALNQELHHLYDEAHKLQMTQTEFKLTITMESL